MPYHIWYIIVGIECALGHVIVNIAGVYFYKYFALINLPYILDLSIFFKANYPVIFAQIIQ